MCKNDYMFVLKFCWTLYSNHPKCFLRLNVLKSEKPVILFQVTVPFFFVLSANVTWIKLYSSPHLWTFLPASVRYIFTCTGGCLTMKWTNPTIPRYFTTSSNFSFFDQDVQWQKWHNVCLSCVIIIFLVVIILYPANWDLGELQHS